VPGKSVKRFNVRVSDFEELQPTPLPCRSIEAKAIEQSASARLRIRSVHASSLPCGESASWLSSHAKLCLPPLHRPLRSRMPALAMPGDSNLSFVLREVAPKRRPIAPHFSSRAHFCSGRNNWHELMGTLPIVRQFRICVIRYMLVNLFCFEPANAWPGTRSVSRLVSGDFSPGAHEDHEEKLIRKSGNR